MYSLLVNLYRRVKGKLLDLVYGKNVDESELIYTLYSGVSRGTMIDVGAHHGSSLVPFARRGWQVYGFEPDPKNREILKKKTDALLSVSISEQAVSDVSGKQVDFYTSDVSTGISSMAKFHESHQRTASVTTITLKDFLAGQEIPTIDFLKIDAEGFDFFVLKGFDWDVNPHPAAIVCEFENKKTIALGYTVDDMCKYLHSKGYKLVISEWFPIVEYGHRHRWKCFLTSAEYITDVNAWGNVIAVKEVDYEALLKVCSNVGRFEKSLIGRELLVK